MATVVEARAQGAQARSQTLLVHRHPDVHDPLVGVYLRVVPGGPVVTQVAAVVLDQARATTTR